MSKKWIIGIIVVIVLGAIFLSSQNKDSPENINSQSQENEQVPENETGQVELENSEQVFNEIESALENI